MYFEFYTTMDINPSLLATHTHTHIEIRAKTT